MSTTNAPAARGKYATEQYAFVTTDSKLFIFGGRSDCNDGSGSNYVDGGIYDPSSNPWILLSSSGGPTTRNEAGAAFSGTYLLYWGGYVPGNTNSLNTGALFTKP